MKNSMSTQPKPSPAPATLRERAPLEMYDDRFRLVVEAAPNAIIVTNAHGQIELVYRQAERLFGYSRSELLGRQVETLIPDRFRPHHPALRGNFMENPSTRPMGAGRDLYAFTKDGREIPIEIGLNPIHTEEGMLVLSSIIDIRERKAAEKRFREQTEQVAAASRYKSEFLANMSHELRTPLNSILILSEQLKNNALNNLTPRQVMHADTIYRSGTDLLALINDILDLSKIEAGRMSTVMEKIPVGDLAESIERNFRPMAESKHLGFHVDVDPRAPAALFSDHQRVFQIIRNLFSNALKFTMEGSIHIRLSGAEADDTRLMISVVDTGIGIPEEKHHMIFDAFRQVDGSTSRRFGGTGLGLSISRSLAELLGGEITVSSQPGQGSTFTLTLPAGMTESHAYLQTREIESLPATTILSGMRGLSVQAGNDLIDELGTFSEHAHPAGAVRQFFGKRLLLVDDDVRNIYAISSILEDMGLDVDIARDGRHALDIVGHDHQIDIIFMDMMMPVMDGYQAIDELKRHRHFNKPIIALTAHAMKGDREKCLVAGADDYLAKPVTQAEVVDMLSRWLEPGKTAT